MVLNSFLFIILKKYKIHFFHLPYLIKYMQITKVLKNHFYKFNRDMKKNFDAVNLSIKLNFNPNK